MAEMTPEAKAKAEALMLDLYAILDRYGEDGDAFSEIFQSLDAYMAAHRLGRWYAAEKAIREEEEREERHANSQFGVGA